MNCLHASYTRPTNARSAQPLRRSFSNLSLTSLIDNNTIADGETVRIRTGLVKVIPKNEVRVTNWAETVEAGAEQFRYPVNEAEVVELVRTNDMVRCSGALHSCAPLISSEGIILSLTKLDKIISLDPETRIVRMQSGVRMHDLCNYLSDYGLAVGTLGTIDWQTICGAVMTGTHGGGLTIPSLHDFVRSYTMVVPDGTLKRVDRDSEPDLFRAMAPSMGLFGAVVEMEMETVPLQILEAKMISIPIDDIIPCFDRLMKTNKYARVIVYPSINKATIWTANPVASRKDAIANGAVNNTGYMDFRNREEKSMLERFLELCDENEFEEADRVLELVLESQLRRMKHYVGQYNHILCLERNNGIPHADIEMNFAYEKHKEVLQTVFDHCDTNRLPYYNFEIRTTAQDDAYLSCCQSRPALWIDFQAKAKVSKGFFSDMTSLLKQYGYRKHWAKGMDNSDPSYIVEQFPDIAKFIKEVKAIDPEGKFRNEDGKLWFEALDLLTRDDPGGGAEERSYARLKESTSEKKNVTKDFASEERKDIPKKIELLTKLLAEDYAEAAGGRSDFLPEECLVDAKEGFEIVIEMENSEKVKNVDPTAENSTEDAEEELGLLPEDCLKDVVSEKGHQLAVNMEDSFSEEDLAYPATRMMYDAIRATEQEGLGECEPVPIVLISDPGQDLDDEMMFIMSSYFSSLGLISIRGVIANLFPSVARARLTRGTFDLLGLHEIPVGIGTDGGDTSGMHSSEQFETTASSYIVHEDDEEAMGELESGHQLLQRLYESAPDIKYCNAVDGEGAGDESTKKAIKGGLTVVITSSFKDISIFVDENPEVFASKTREVVVMGGCDPITSEANECTPDSAQNNTFDPEASAHFYSQCQRMNITLTVVSRHSAYAAKMPRSVYDDLALTGSAIGLRLRDSQRAGIDQLWQRASSDDPRVRKGLPPRCDRGWFTKTFCGGTDDPRRSGDDSVWDLVTGFMQYDTLALLASIPVVREVYFDPSVLPPLNKTGAAAGAFHAGTRNLIGISEKEHNLKDPALLVQLLKTGYRQGILCNHSSEEKKLD